MDTYSTLREFADSWVLLALTCFFLGTIVWAFRPGSRATHHDAGQVPFRHDTPEQQPCARACPDCTCRTAFALPEERHHD